MDYQDKIKTIPIPEYARVLGFTVVKKGSRYCSLKEHDSVMIDVNKNCYWRNSVFARGMNNPLGAAGSVIDFAVEFGGYTDVKQAMRGLWERFKPFNGVRENNTLPCAEQRDFPRGGLELPQAVNGTARAYDYLVSKRKIEPVVARYFIKHGLVYQDIHNNAVFVSRNDAGAPVFACWRGTGEGRYVRDCIGSDYNECFFIKGTSRTVVVTESVIEAMSYMSLLAMDGKRFCEYSYLALSGTNKIASLFYHLDKLDADNVVLALNNDKGGLKATESAAEELIERGYNGRFTIDIPKVLSQDWNDVLCETKA